MVKNNTLVAACENGNTIAKKRGRKSKKEIELAKAADAEKKLVDENINVIIEETGDKEITQNIDELLKSTEFIDSEENQNIVEENSNLFSEVTNQPEDNSLEDNKPVAKKRGRKPKGGKIIQQIAPLNNTKESKPNIILHLKCSIKDLCLNTANSADIQGFDFQNSTQLAYDEIITETNPDIISMNQTKNNDYEHEDYEGEKSHKDNDIRDVWKKLKILEHNLHINNICDKKSACFWCTYDFDNPPVYIPKHFIKESYHVYGCFCSPECATAYLMEESIDSSSKFERYHLINHIYSKIYDYKKNIKPAPNPYYMLDKYYGNLSIQEYRSLLRNERLFLVVDKPLTRILPELHEDNDDFIINNKIIPSNTYQIKKKLQKKQTKTNILSEKFGLNQ
jgi:hypothetical protein